MNTLSLDQTVSMTAPAQFELDIPAGMKLHVVYQAATGVEADFYGPFADGVPLVTHTGNGYLRVCGSDVNILRLAPGGRNLVDVTGKGMFTLTVSKSTILDVILSWLYYRWFKGSKC